MGTYQCHLRRLAAVERRFPRDAKERVLEQAILECARLGKSESTIKGIISAAIMATEVRLVDACITATIWRSVKAAKKTRTAAKERIWGLPIMLLHMAARTSSLEDWAVVGLAIVSFQLFRRVGEAVTLQPWAVVDDAVRFFDSQTRQDWQQRSLTALTREWLQWLRRHFPEPAAEGRRPWTTQQLEKGMQRLLVGSPFEGARWHAWRRAGARAMWTAGATIRQVAVWGRWARDSTARWYAHPTETQPVQAEDFWPRPPREGAGGRWRSRTTSLRLEQLWPSGIRKQWKHRKEHVAFGPSRTMLGPRGIRRRPRAGRGASCDRRGSSPSTGRHPAKGAAVGQGRDKFRTVGSKCRPPRPSQLRPTADPQRKPLSLCAWSLSSKGCALRRPEHRGISSEYGEPRAACPTRLTPPPLSGELWLCIGGFGALLAVLVRLVSRVWWVTVVYTSCVACVCRVGARVTSDATVGAERPSKARFRETMYQLSLRFAQKWGVEQGCAYKALDVFRREVLQLSEDLRDDKPLLTWVHLCEAMVMEGLRELLDGIYPAVPEGEVTPEMAAKGIGSVGAVPLPGWLWQIYVSPRQEFLLSSAEEVRKVRRATADMLSAIARTGVLRQLSKQEADALGIPWSPTAAAFTIPKNETKARLILHGVRANQRQWEGGYKVPRVSLPQVESVAEVFSQGLRGWGANIDVTNCYWSILLPEGKSHLFHVGGEECMWVFKTPPFGWSYSPLLCQRLLAHLTGKVGLEVAGAVLRLMHYLDDFLVFGDSEAAVATKLAAFKEVLANAGFLISDKSSSRPERELVFLGKRVDFGRGVILNTRHTLEGALSRYVLMASRPVTRKSVQRVVGKLIWVCRPSHWSNLFLAGPIAHVQWGAKWMPRPPGLCIAT